MNFLDLMKSRGLLKQVTHEEELHAHLEEGPRAAYLGYDPTADSLHVGHLLATLVLRRWQATGNRVVALMGGGTGLIGDPTGKTDMRKMLDEKDIEHNISRFKIQIGKILDLSDPEKGIIVNNGDWFSEMKYIPFIRDIGKHFSVNRMLTAECFKSRLEKGLTFLEFNYMLLQGYDFLELHRREDVTLQIGGDDQWSNMLGGVDLVRRVRSDKAFCLTYPLLTTSEGKKMGKTESGAVWLDPDKTTPYDFFQYWRNVEDVKVEELLRFMTDLPLEEISSLCSEGGASINQAKVVLAHEVTKIVHGEEEANKAKETASNLFKTGGSGAGGNVTEFEVTRSAFGEGMPVCDFLTTAGIFKSKSEVRRLVEQNGLAINGEKVSDINDLVENSHIGEEGILVKKGKKHYFRVIISD